MRPRPADGAPISSLVERGLFESRAKAQAAIAAGLVTADDAPVRKASDAIAPDAALAATPAFRGCRAAASS